jgi:hypothetical protein
LVDGLIQVRLEGAILRLVLDNIILQLHFSAYFIGFQVIVLFGLSSNGSQYSQD